MISFVQALPDQNRIRYQLDDNRHLPDILEWAVQHEKVSFLQHQNFNTQNNIQGINQNYQFLLGFSYSENIDLKIITIEQLNNSLSINCDWHMGFVSYEYGLSVHQIRSRQIAPKTFDTISFFIPDVVIYQSKSHVYIESKQSLDLLIFEHQVLNHPKNKVDKKLSPFIPTTSKQKYIDDVNKIKDHIQIGDVYELNYCQNFNAKNCIISPYETYQKLVQISPMPFSAFISDFGRYALCASPERFMMRKGETIISQPIKGTIRKTSDELQNRDLAQQLYSNQKERAENVMIVDLVRNDLSRIAQKGTVKVDELFGIYEFSQLFQMISTVSAIQKKGITLQQCFDALFPMGSMTGAPKHRALELIDRYEDAARGLYSGSIGYVAPNGDFDFNVVIRTLFYDKLEQELSFSVGSAITILADAEQEYNECLLKSKAILEALSS